MSLTLSISTNIPKSGETNKYSLSLTIGSDSVTQQKVYVGQDNPTEGEITETRKNEKNEDESNTYDPNHYFQLVELSLNKQMYRPGEINARIHIWRNSFSWSEQTTENGRSQCHLFSLDDLTTYFKNCGVSLQDNSGNSIAKGYKIKKLTPEYTTEKTSIYLNLKIYSPDIALTGTIENAVNVAKQLGKEILKKKCSDEGIGTPSVNPQNKLAYHTYTTVKRAGQDKQAITATDEYIHPYLVQYNESFYDMLIRTANRWGEFVYFEGEQLVLGLNVSSVSDITTYDSISYINDTPRDSVANVNSKAAVVSDDYLEVIKRSNKPKHDGVRGMSLDKQKEANQYILQTGDMYALDDAYWHKFVQGILNMNGNVFDWALNSNLADGIKAAQNEFILWKLEEKYNHHFFIDPLSETDETKLARIKKHYSNESSPQKCCQFAYYDKDTDTGGLTKSAYKDVLDKEITAGQNILSIDLGTTYTHLCLGNEFKLSGDSTYYLVTGVKCITEKGADGKNKLHFYVTAIKNTSVETKYDPSDSSKDTDYRVYYPPMLPSGHVRFSGPQRGKVQDTLDPMLNGRYRVFFAWQNGSGDSSPWLRVSREMTKEGSGGVWQLEKDMEVLLDFHDGNVELPYIIGTLQETEKRSNARSTMFNNLDLTTPAGHSIRLSDGMGAGSANFIASCIPVVGLIKGFTPDLAKAKFKEGKDRYYDGGIEMTDYYGIYSIKASTTDRNISIKSPYGDVTLSAFTGITISAPNGNVKISGKNVSIEAGNNLSIVSGKNVLQGFGGSWFRMGKDATAENFASDVGGAASKLLDAIDLSLLRHTLEVFLRPIEGTLTVKSNRFLKLEAGKGAAGFPLSGYNVVSYDDAHKVYKTIKYALQISDFIANHLYEYYKACCTCVQTYANDLCVQQFASKTAAQLIDEILPNVDRPDYDYTKDADLGYSQEISLDDRIIRGQLLVLAAESNRIVKMNDQKANNVLIRKAIADKANALKTAIKNLRDFVNVTLSGYTQADDPTKFAAELQNATRAVTTVTDPRWIMNIINNDIQFKATINVPVESIGSFVGVRKQIKRVILHSLLEEFRREKLIYVVNVNNKLFNNKILINSKIFPPVIPTIDDALCDTRTWRDYLKGVKVCSPSSKLQKGKNPTLQKLIDNVNVFSNVLDYRVWGTDHDAGILFSSDNNTYKLGQEITPQRVDYNGVSAYGEDPTSNIDENVQHLFESL